MLKKGVKTKKKLMKKNGKKEVTPQKHIKTANLYALWMSLPLFFRKQSPKAILELGFAIPEELEEIFEIKTKIQFSKVYSVSPTQMLAWEKTTWFAKKVEEFEKIINVKKLRKSIDMAFTRRTLKDPNSFNVKLWKELYDDYEEKSKITFGWE